MQNIPLLTDNRMFKCEKGLLNIWLIDAVLKTTSRANYVTSSTVAVEKEIFGQKIKRLKTASSEQCITFDYATVVLKTLQHVYLDWLKLKIVNAFPIFRILK